MFVGWVVSLLFSAIRIALLLCSIIVSDSTYMENTEQLILLNNRLTYVGLLVASVC